MSQFLINLALALATADLLHNIAEATNIRGKVARLSAYINKQPYTEMKVKIDTRAKAYAITLISFIFLVGLPMIVFSLLNLTISSAFWYIVVVLTISYFVLAVLVDKYHVEIERVTRPFMKKK